jgi:hypothetical protein
MLRGDISNETPPRIIVGIDAVVISELEEKKPLLGKATVTRKVVSLNNPALSKLWNISFNYGIAIELAAFEAEGWTQGHIDKLMDKLERRGGNPFNYAELYSDIQDFISELPYRTNLKGVIDSPEKAGRYGSWRVDLEFL